MKFVKDIRNQTLIAMKNLFVVTLILMATFSTTKAINEGPKSPVVSLKAVEDGKALFRYKTIPQNPVFVNVYDSNQRLMNSQRLLKKNSFAKYYDFSSLEPGEYIFEIIERGQDAKRIPFKFEKKETPRPIAYSEFEILTGNRLNLKFNALNPTGLTITAFEDGKQIHEERIFDTAALERVYRLKGVSPMAELEIAIQSNDGYQTRYKIK
ncbi:hypothetical protein A33Q_4215 [Indibacter alkaliphilus LW1]|uniref:Por secretion system C-terminal sorting domain-containing protein n=2 Tax=Indibacter TaxID=647744 RepID=S2CY93_INDAL|nr:hypothetical protein A33Q_4215 [Indibacter alkaliphilus LW1]